jgi:hypothetical protein
MATVWLSAEQMTRVDIALRMYCGGCGSQLMWGCSAPEKRFCDIKLKFNESIKGLKR